MTYRLYCESVAGITASAAHADWLCRLVALIDRADWVRLLVAQMARIPSGGIGYLYLPVPRLGQLFSPDLYRLRSEEHTSELQSRGHLVCRLLLEKKKRKI